MDDKLELSYNSENSVNNKKKRCCICVFWDKQGIVRDYVIYYIKGLQEIAEEVIVTVNGEITKDSREKLKNLGVQVFQRENKGLDFGAWKDTIEKIGYSKLSEYNELIITNTTCYGPIYPLSEMFDEMEAKGCDFWGITKHPDNGYFTIKDDVKSKVIEHIQSYFLVFNKNVILSDAFKKWWDNIEYYNDYNKVVGYYETKLTKYFEDAGFKSDSYIDINSHKDFTSNPMICTDKILQNKHLPLIKRKAIILDYDILIGLSLTHHNNKILQYIKNNTNYDIDMIYDDIISTQTMSNIKSNLHLNYVLPSDYSFSEPNNNQKIALILYIYYEDLIEYCFNYAKSIPENSDIYIVSSKETTLEECRKKDYILKDYHIEYRLKQNQGRNVSAYLVTCADVFEKYDLICCMHDKKTPHANAIYGQDFMYQCFECNLKNKDYVKNILNIFDKNKRIGMLTNPTPKFMHLAKDYFWNELGVNSQIVKDLYKELNLKIPFDKHPVAPFGSMFWIRKDAIKPLFRKKWKYKDFPNEPLPPDGTISHAIERIYPSVAQEAGYMTGWIMPENFASIYTDNLTYKPAYPDKNEMVYNNLLEVLFSVKDDNDKKYAIITLAGNKIRIKRKRKKNTIKYRPLERLFSVKNANDKKHKIITLVGIAIKFKKKHKHWSDKDVLKYYEDAQKQLQSSEYYVPLNNTKLIINNPVKLLAFYLPQFHTFKENELWHGKGFTEWTNVTKALPQYAGHYQPHLPIDVGFYDLSTDKIMYRQIELAKTYGLFGFCFHYYWFSGKRLMETPIFNYLNNKDLDFPFCLCWANENLTRKWDGNNNEILMEQHLNKDDWKKFADDIMPFFDDERYIKINDCPVLIIYRPGLFNKDIFLDFVKNLRAEISKKHKGLYLIMARTWDTPNKTPSDFSMDAAVEFPPQLMQDLVLLNEFVYKKQNFSGNIIGIEKCIDNNSYIYDVNYPLYKTVFPSWDNTARRANTPHIYETTPKLYKKWLTGCIEWTKQHHKPEEQFVFINAWNEWAEGTHLEPDRKYGYAYLQATREALEETADSRCVELK